MILKNKFPLLLLLCCSITLFSQNSTEVCESEEDDLLLDLNSITKCIIKENDDKKTKDVSFQVSSRRHIKRNRKTVNGVVNQEHNQEITNFKQKTSLINKLSLKNTGNNSNYFSFHKVDEIPLFDNCKKSRISEQKKCFKKQISHHVNTNLEYPEKSFKEGIQGRVLINFVIDKNGETSITNTLFPYKGEELKKEAIRIINKLPTFIPGKQSSVKVDVQYTLKVIFDIPGVTKTNIRKKPKEVTIDKFYAIDELDTLPLFKKCAINNDNSSDCFINELEKHVGNNFAYPLKAIENNTEGTIFVNFIIDTQGEVVNIMATGAENTLILKNSAKKLIQKLPPFKPAIKNNKKVNTKYQFPIKFSLDD